MNALVQNLVVGAIVVAAAGYLFWSLYRFFAGKRTGGCGKCPGSCTSQNSQGQPLVQLELKPPLRP